MLSGPGSVTLNVHARFKIGIERSFCIKYVEVVHEVVVYGCFCIYSIFGSGEVW